MSHQFPRCLAAASILCLASFGLTSALPDAIECGTYKKYYEEEIVSDNSCSPTAEVARRKALRNLELLLISLEDAHCLDDGCTPDSCNLSLTFVDGYSHTLNYNAQTGCWTATASVSGEVIMTCSPCDPA